MCGELKRLASAAMNCRQAQKLYFLERSKENLARAKESEKRLDRALGEILQYDVDQLG